MTGREVAWRVLAEEFNASTTSEKGEGDRPATYVVSPLGARMNRVMIVGELAPPESGGVGGNAPFYRAQLIDPSGAIVVTAGSYQPRAAAQLQRVKGISRALVVGKAHLFQGGDGSIHPSVRAEAIRVLDLEEYRLALAEVAIQTLERMNKAPVQGEAARADSAAANRTPLLAAVHRCLDALEGGPASVSPIAAPPRTVPSPSGGSRPVRITRAPVPPPARVISAAERAQESALLDLVDELADSTIDGYADLREVTRQAAASGIPAPLVDELVQRLSKTGVIEEPLVGKLRRA